MKTKKTKWWLLKPKKQVKKPWCLYRFSNNANWFGYGKIFETTKKGKAAYVLYLENQKFPPRVWSVAYLKRFTSLKEAIDFFIKENKLNKKEIYKLAKEKFPNEI